MSVKFLQISLFPFIKVIFKIVYLDNYLTGKLPAQNYSRITWARKENVFPSNFMNEKALRNFTTISRGYWEKRAVTHAAWIRSSQNMTSYTSQREEYHNRTQKPHLKINNVKHCCFIPAKEFISNDLYGIERLLFSWLYWIISEFRRSSLRIARDASAAKSSSRKK